MDDLSPFFQIVRGGAKIAGEEHGIVSRRGVVGGQSDQWCASVSISNEIKGVEHLFHFIEVAP